MGRKKFQFFPERSQDYSKLGKSSPKENSDRNDPPTHVFLNLGISLNLVYHKVEVARICTYTHIQLLKTKKSVPYC